MRNLTWRMLALAVALTQCQGGALLVDEIDTGLHHTVMSKMWESVYRAAIDLECFRLLHANVRAILTVAEEMRCFE